MYRSYTDIEEKVNGSDPRVNIVATHSIAMWLLMHVPPPPLHSIQN